MMRDILMSIAVAIVSYLLGCFSTGLMIAGRSGVNLREAGSKNTGASNVLRVMGVKKGIVTFAGDFLKAILACWLGSLLLPGATFGINGFGMMLAGLCVILGHNWPVFYGFRGGKGVACSVAVIFFVNPLWGIIAILLCVAVIAITKFISLGSMVLLLSYALMIWIVHPGEWFPQVWTAVLFILCVFRHRANIGRLVKGTENKIGQKAKGGETAEIKQEP